MRPQSWLADCEEKLGPLGAWVLRQGHVLYSGDSTTGADFLRFVLLICPRALFCCLRDDGQIKFVGEQPWPMEAPPHDVGLPAETKASDYVLFFMVLTFGKCT